jgi:hypothetical protein
MRRHVGTQIQTVVIAKGTKLLFGGMLAMPYTLAYAISEVKYQKKTVIVAMLPRRLRYNLQQK